MGTFLLVTIISCNQLMGILNRLQSVISLTTEQKIDIILELRKVVPSCPLIINKK